jgi:hypothetical protein
VVQASAATALRQVSPQPDVVAVGQPAMDVQAAQAVPQQKTVQQAQPLPAAQLMAKATLFAESQRPTAVPAQLPSAVSEPARPSLFNAVTGAFRRRGGPAGAAPAQPVPLRREPEMAEYQAANPHVSVRQTSGEETGIEIPAFLRRQHS